MLEQFAQYGLVGLMIAGIYIGIAWAGKQLLGKNGILRATSTALNGVTACLEKHNSASMNHAFECQGSNHRMTALHRAALSAIDEIEQECQARGIDVSDRCNRVRRELTDAHDLRA